MTDSPYPKGWPRYVGGGYLCEFEALQVVPLSDAERLREALGDLIETVRHNLYMSRYAGVPSNTAAIERAEEALNPERGE